jgi:predicted RecB family nuclease
MQRLADILIFSPSDLNHFLECEYLTRLDMDVANGRALEKHRPAEADLLAAKGESHERLHLARFREQGRRVAEIPDPGASVDWMAAADATRQAMIDGAEVVYQGVLLADGWRGRADFLVKVASPSALGGWSYEVWDTKLARRAKPSHVLQLAYYSEQVAAIQRAEPAWMHVILGDGEEVRFRCRDFSAYFRTVRARFLRAVEDGSDVSPYPVPHCGLCGYADHCGERWEAEDHVSLVAGIRRSQVERLSEAGVSTCSALAGTSMTPGIGESVLGRLRHQAMLQTHFRTTGEHRYDLLQPTEENGFRLMPQPSPGDVFFDMEGYPFFEASGGLEYLFGAVTAGTSSPEFHVFRADDRAGEKRAFEQLTDFIWNRLRKWPDLHVYHYSQYEPTALKRLTALHATREEEVDEFLRREVFVDLYHVVRRSICISHDSYSIKAVRQFFMPQAGKGKVTGGAGSMIEFQRWLDTGDPHIMEAIERYNEEDCVSTLLLRDWLLERKREAEDRFRVTIPCFTLPARRDEPVETDPDEHADLRARLSSITEPWATTLGWLLDYHRREAKPEWWAYFQRRKKSLDELMEDTEAVAYLRPTDDAPVLKKQSLVYTLEFPPQEFKLKVDAEVQEPLGAGPAGTIEWIDASRGRLGLRRGKKRSQDALPAAIIAGGPVPDNAQRAAIVRVAEAAAMRRSPYRAVQALLRSDAPCFRPARRGSIQTLGLDAQKRLVADLDDSYLFVQGPPGSGKTWLGARLIVAILASGKRVGVTAPNHRAIHNLLEEVERVAIQEHLEFRGLKKRSVSDETAFEGRFITSVAKNEEIEAADAQLIAGTAWLFARDGMDQALDYLFIDEAGQVALADAVAVGTAARNIVLLGDPQQLPHVTQNTHPEGSGCSVLEHLLGELATVAEDRGLFLAHSWRMHQDICRFVSELSYDGRLASAPACALQKVSSVGFSGAGLRHIVVNHRHNAQQSVEEAAAVAAEVQRLLDGGTVTRSDGRTTRLLPADVLVVAPYNMQVRCLREVLPDGVEVGTVDKFQGREAAVVFFSMASSSGEDVPRGLEFLFNRNRFNVAISRAKCLSVVVCSPRLVETQCRTVDQMRSVSAVCQFVEQASPEPEVPTQETISI